MCSPQHPSLPQYNSRVLQRLQEIFSHYYLTVFGNAVALANVMCICVSCNFTFANTCTYMHMPYTWKRGLWPNFTFGHMRNWWHSSLVFTLNLNLLFFSLNMHSNRSNRVVHQKSVGSVGTQFQVANVAPCNCNFSTLTGIGYNFHYINRYIRIIIASLLIKFLSILCYMILEIQESKLLFEWCLSHQSHLDFGVFSRKQLNF